ncbi:MAG: ATP-dependent 6-phosphofructokinase [Deltaproteobacteria bacterium]|nr:MAG: ATP-dependent 6-phosphofructokinase [Deltaproteobacteria bacterium]
MTRRIGLTTGGGDCPGLNAAIRAVVLRAAARGMEVLGIEDGLLGLLAGTGAGVRLLRPDDVEPILNRGGTILGTTNRGNPLAFPMADGSVVDRGDEIVARARELDLECIVMAGGDGTQSIGLELAARGLAVIGLPKTIDNDLSHTEATFGFATAVGVAVEALDRLRTTAESHERVMILEVMGRGAGWIALEAGIAGGAHVVLLPEIPYDPDVVADAIRRRRRAPRPFALVVVAEGAHPPGEAPPRHAWPGTHGSTALGGAGMRCAELLAQRVADCEIRVTVLGHTQRGGTPVPFDRLLATRLGTEAADAAYERDHGVLMAWVPPDVRRIPLDPTIRTPRLVDPASQVVRHAEALGICLGRIPPA